jgi:hypothetical protein
MRARVSLMVMFFAMLFVVAACHKDDKKTSLDAWTGTYSVTAESYYGDAQEPASTDFDETWTVVVSAVDTNDAMLKFIGIGGSDSTIFATLDADLLTIVFKPGQSLGNIYGYGNTKIYLGTNDVINNIGNDVTQDFVTSIAGYPIPGTISDLTGGIVIDKFSEIFEGPYVYDVFKTTWVKQLK